MKPPPIIGKVFVSAFLSLATCCLSAQDNYTIKNFNTDNGLPQNSIIGMTMDYDGYLWMATQSGLIRYDGISFKPFLFNPNMPDKSNDVRFILNLPLDKKTVLGTGDGLNYFIENGKPVLKPDIYRTGFIDILLGYFPSLSFYYKLISSLKNHLVEKKWTSYFLNVLPLNSIDFIVGYENTRLLFYYKNGVYTREIPIDTDMRAFLIINGYRFVKDANSNFYLYDSTTYRFKKVQLDWKALNATPEDNKEVAFYPDKTSQKTWCSYNSTFYSVDFDPAKKQISFLPQFSINDKDHSWRGIVYDSISSTFFLSTLTEGIFQVKMKKIQTINTNSKLPKGLEAGSIVNYAVLKTSDTTAIIPSGIEFISTASGIRTQKLGNIFGNRETIALLNNDTILCTAGNGVYYYARKDGFTKKQVYNKFFNQYNNSAVLLLYPEGDSIWAATNDGLFCLTKTNSTPVVLYKEGSNSTNFSALRFFYRVNKNEAIIANGANSFRLKTTAPYKAVEIPELKGKQIRHINTWNNVLIFSVYRYGLYIQKDNVFYKVPISEGAEDISSCHSTYIDKDGHIWVTTNKGLFKSTVASVVESALHPGNTAFFYYFGKDDGITNTEFNGAGTPPFAVLKNEQLFYPSMGGIVSFNPYDLDNKIIKTPAIVEKIWINDKEADLLTDSIYLRPNFKYLVLELAASHFGDPRNLSLEYKLDNTEWKKIKAINNLRITLVDIPSGKHQLVIRKRTGFGATDYAYTTLAIFKKKHIYEQAWFYIALAAIFGFLIWLFLELKTRSINRKRIELQKQVDEQTAELSKTVEVKDLLINIISHDMATPLRHISFVSEILSRGLEKNPEKVNDALTDIKATSDKILSGSLTMINWIKYNNKEITLNKKALHLYNLVNETFEIYTPIAKTKGISLINDVPKSKFAEADYYILTTILNNLVSNAIKNTNKGEIKISYELSEMETDSILRVSDTGRGMNQEMLHVIRGVLNGDLHIVKTTNKVNTGLGFVMIAELIKIHGLSVSVESEAGKGTVVSVIIPQ